MQHAVMTRCGRLAAGAGRQRPSRRALAALVVVAASGSHAQQTAAPTRAVAVLPYAAVMQTVTDNYNLSAVGKSADAITRLTGGVSVEGRSAQLRGFVDYSLSRLQYLSHGSDSKFQHNLNGSGRGDFWDGRLSVTAGATVTQGALSAFGASTANSELANGNAAEVRTWHVTPILRGRAAGSVAYVGQFSVSGVDIAKQAIGDSNTALATIQLAPVQRTKLGWSADAQHVTQQYKGGRTTNSDRLLGGVVYVLDDLDLQLSARGGYESSNVSTLNSEGRASWGAGLLWVPSPRTRVEAGVDNRFFGRSHNVRAEYRTPRTVWQLSALRDLNANPLQTLPGSRNSNFELFYSQLASSVPDRNKRVDATLEFLRSKNINPFAPPDAGLLAGATILVDRVDFSAAWRGARDTAILSLGRSNSRRIDALAATIDVLGLASQIRTRNLSLNLSHQLTPDSSLALNTSVTDAEGNFSNQRSRQRLVSLHWNAALGRQVFTSLGLRHAVYDQSSSSYSENALSASLNARF